MDASEIARRINATGFLHADARADGRVDVVADYAPALAERDFDSRWVSLFAGGRFCNVRLELEGLTDHDLRALGSAVEIVNLNLKGNRSVTAQFFRQLPPTIGLESVDVAATALGDDGLLALLDFPKLAVIWGHNDQFSKASIIDAKVRRPHLRIELIY